MTIISKRLLLLVNQLPMDQDQIFFMLQDLGNFVLNVAQINIDDLNSVKRNQSLL